MRTHIPGKLPSVSKNEELSFKLLIEMHSLKDTDKEDTKDFDNYQMRVIEVQSKDGKIRIPVFRPYLPDDTQNVVTKTSATHSWEYITTLYNCCNKIKKSSINTKLWVKPDAIAAASFLRSIVPTKHRVKVILNALLYANDIAGQYSRQWNIFRNKKTSRLKQWVAIGLISIILGQSENLYKFMDSQDCLTQRSRKLLKLAIKWDKLLNTTTLRLSAIPKIMYTQDTSRSVPGNDYFSCISSDFFSNFNIPTHGHILNNNNINTNSNNINIDNTNNNQI